MRINKTTDLHVVVPASIRELNAMLRHSCAVPCRERDIRKQTKAIRHFAKVEAL